MVTIIRNTTGAIMLMTAILLVGCTQYDGLGINNISETFVLLDVTMTESRESTLSSMNPADLAFQNDSVVIYHLNDHRKLVAYEFHEDRLDGAVVYVYKDIINWTKAKSIFADYEVKSEVTPNQGAYFNREKNLYGEISSITKDGIEYFCIGLSSIR